MIYLDHNATSPPWPEVLEAMTACAAKGLANPASQHAAGRAARAVLEAARDEIASYLGADLSGRPADRLILTSGATEANNLVLRGLIGDPPGGLIVSAVEHPSVAAVADELERRGHWVARLGVSSLGCVDPAELDSLLHQQRGGVRLVSIVAADSETGVLQPLADLAEVCHRHDVPLHTDATQAVGKLPFDFRQLGLAALSFSGHKFQGPAGCGGLLLRADLHPRPLALGGFQQSGIRPGTESPVLAVGLARALARWQSDRDRLAGALASQRNRLESALAAGFPGLIVHGRQVARVPQTSNMAFPGLDRQALHMALDLAGVAAATGTACASGSSEPSPILRAWGLAEPIVGASLRFSLGPGTTPEEIDSAAATILAAAGRLLARRQPTSDRQSS